MKSNYSEKRKTAKEMYWDAVNLMTAKYRDVLVDIKRREDNHIYDGLGGCMQLLEERRTVIDKVANELGISNGLVYGLDNELVETHCVLEMAESYVSSSSTNEESNRRIQIFWSAVDIIDREYGDLLRLLYEHLEILELVEIPDYDTWIKWFNFRGKLIQEIITKFHDEYNYLDPNEIIVDEYGKEWDYERLIHYAIMHVGSYIPWEERMRNKEKTEGSINWFEEYRSYTTPH